ncbi:hypothetical protein F4V58_11545 [Corynebacterium phocae]|nr:hypothetical protein F4V58_11545 [Corynebacterium phocae]
MRILNAELAHALARLGHADRFASANCGLPIPSEVEVIDLALVFGVPTFVAVAEAVLVVVEQIALAPATPTDGAQLLGLHVSRETPNVVPKTTNKQLSTTGI